MRASLDGDIFSTNTLNPMLNVRSRVLNKSVTCIKSRARVPCNRTLSHQGSLVLYTGGATRREIEDFPVKKKV